MRRLATLLLPALMILIAGTLIGSPQWTSASPPEPAPDDSSPSRTGDPPAASAKGALEAAAPAEGVAEANGPVDEDVESAHARALLFSLRFAAESSSPHFPTMEVEESARLMTRRPETAKVFIEALDDASRELRAVLIHTFHRVEDGILRSQLLAAWNKTDPTARRLREILADREKILATLENGADSDLLYDLIARLGSPLLEDPEITNALLVLARSSGDLKIRNRALSRVGMLDNAEVRGLLLSTLSDPLRDPTERQTAARVLIRRPGPDTTPVFLEVLEMNEAAPLLRFAALGLKNSGRDARVSEALFNLFFIESADETARKNAATALSHTVRAAPEGSVRSIEQGLRSALLDLSQQKTSHAVLVHAMAEMSRGLAGRFDDDLVGIVRAQGGEEFRVLLVADPTLKRFLEAL